MSVAQSQACHRLTEGRPQRYNWLRVFRSQKLLAAVIREANRDIREQGGQKNMWDSRTDVGREWA
jgi:hypothetical protein